MPKSNSPQQQNAALAEAQEHLSKLGHVEIELSACQEVIREDENTLHQLRARRASVTDVTEMLKLSTEQRTAEAAAADHRDLLEVLQNRRATMRVAVPGVAQQFTNEYNKLASQMTAEFEAKYREFLETAVRPLLEYARAIPIASVSNIVAGLVVPNPDGRSDFARNGVLISPSPTPPSMESQAASARIAPWATISHRLQDLQRELEREEFQAKQTRARAEHAKGTRFTNARQGSGYTPPAPQTPARVEIIPTDGGPNSRVRFAHMNPSGGA